MRLNNDNSGLINFSPLSDLNLAQSCDIVIDAAAGNGQTSDGKNIYQEFTGPIILQDGEYPKGRLITSPLLAPAQGGNKYRQGGCFLSGVVPVLAAFQDIMERAQLHLVMQHDSRESDFLITERLNSFRVADYLIPRLESELAQLFPETEISIAGIIQIPGLLHYAVTLSIESKQEISVQETRLRLSNMPRLRFLPDPVNSTYDVNLARVTDDRIPPIMVFEQSLRATKRHVHLKLALYYRTLAVLPNIDTIRIIASGVDPIKAMRQTDIDLGFTK